MAVVALSAKRRGTAGALKSLLPVMAHVSPMRRRLLGFLFPVLHTGGNCHALTDWAYWIIAARIIRGTRGVRILNRITPSRIDKYTCHAQNDPSPIGTCALVPALICLLAFYVLATSKVISGWLLTCDSVRLYSVASLGHQATSTMTRFPTQ